MGENRSVQANHERSKADLDSQMNAKTVKERQAALKARRAAEGLKEMRSLYAHPGDFKRIRDYVARLNNARCKAR